MLPVIAALSIAFVVFHIVPSHPPIRDALVRSLGRGPYLGLYSLVNLAVFVPLLFLWFGNRLHEPALWAVRDPATTGVVQLVMLFGMALAAAGSMDAGPNSITVHQGNLSAMTPEVRGIGAVTRHPLSVGLGLVAAGHLIVNGWPADLWFWGSLFVLSFVGAWHQDVRQRREPRYAAYQQQTSFLPDPRGLGRLTARSWAGLGVGVIAGLALRFAHPWFV